MAPTARLQARPWLKARTLATVRDARSRSPARHFGSRVCLAVRPCARLVSLGVGGAMGYEGLARAGSVGEAASSWRSVVMDSGPLRIRVEDAEYRLEAGTDAVIGRDDQAEI